MSCVWGREKERALFFVYSPLHASNALGSFLRAQSSGMSCATPKDATRTAVVVSNSLFPGRLGADPNNG